MPLFAPANIRPNRFGSPTDVHPLGESRIDLQYHLKSALYPTFGQLLPSDYACTQVRECLRKVDVDGS